MTRTTIDLRALVAEAASARRAQVTNGPALGIPGDNATRNDVRFTTELRAKKVERDGLDWYEVEGYASVAEAGYEMFDWFGPYTEIVDAGAFTETLSASPLVVYRENHTGTPMATTRNGRLILTADSTGLHDRAYLNPKREDVARLVTAIEDRDVTEQSFMFRITGGTWSPNYDEYRITRVDLDRGDVGPVTYGANPHTSVNARSADFLADLASMPPSAARAALQVLSTRADLGTSETPAATGRGVSMLRAQLGV
jgi:HK97 family phage prohead protease